MGLPMAIVDVEDALSGSWRRYERAVDVVRVQDPPPAAWPQLREAGFLPKPQVLHWRAEACGSEEEYFARLPRKDRYDIRVAYRHAAAQGLELTVEPLTAELFDEFLTLYERQIAGMRNGMAVAAEQRDKILAEAGTYFAVLARSGRELAGACLNQDLTAFDEIRARFSAITSEQRADGLARVLYCEILREARRRRRHWVSLGRDINLYGHVGNPGLFSFKSRLGFTPVPSQRVEPGSGSHQADRLIAFTTLSDPALVLSYEPAATADAAVRAPLNLNVFTADVTAIDVRSYRGVGLGSTAVHELKTLPAPWQWAR